MKHLPVFLITATAAAAADFKKDVQPILEKNCYECHSEKHNKRKAGYVFDDLATLKLDINPKGAIVPGNPKESHFFEVVSNPDHKAHMPPDDNLSAKDLETLREWITDGAMLDKDGPKPELVPVKKDLPPIMSWTNFEGKKIKAGFVKLEGDMVYLRMPINGKEVPYPMDKLDAASQQQAKECAAP
ncbi:Planctomycete cytochrome C [Prosthecobacter debontii]|uniref:Planctomycete cytochrome C n=1 Tax=Prosthecobacter debontii TaxID=48467 RepID=A0A1T4Y430_9BACT|nr:c-type cytochrome domain-containing protein [Prosthecobacter debontii]SKA96510.1 Planctomycete cytochrome C [Prosthecobacter debontii]